jgi:hypothetical protein
VARKKKERRTRRRTGALASRPVHKAPGERADWCTPGYVVEAVREALGGAIDFDPCSNPRSVVGARVALSLENAGNGLAASWDRYPTIFVNPPFGDGISRWVGRCVGARRDHRATVILLLPVAPETAWWQEMVFPTATAIAFPDHRIAFLDEHGKPVDQPPMACALVYWGADLAAFVNAFRPLGAVVPLCGVAEPAVETSDPQVEIPMIWPNRPPERTER